jgi:hypothetical protein
VCKKSKLAGAASKMFANGVSQARPEKSESAMNPTIVGSIPELLTALRARRDELQISNETIDDIAGLAERHASKILAPNFPSRGLGRISFPLILGALGMGIARVEIVEDPEAIARVQGRWLKWKRLPYGSPRLSKKQIEHARPVVLRDLSKLGNAARKALLPGKQRSEIAKKAALARWRKSHNSDL